MVALLLHQHIQRRLQLQLRRQHHSRQRRHQRHSRHSSSIRIPSHSIQVPEHFKYYTPPSSTVLLLTQCPQGANGYYNDPNIHGQPNSMSHPNSTGLHNSMGSPNGMDNPYAMGISDPEGAYDGEQPYDNGEDFMDNQFGGEEDPSMMGAEGYGEEYSGTMNGGFGSSQQQPHMAGGYEEDSEYDQGMYGFPQQHGVNGGGVDPYEQPGGGYGGTGGGPGGMALGHGPVVTAQYGQANGAYGGGGDGW